MTPTPALGSASRPPAWLLAAPVLLVVLAAVLTPAVEFDRHQGDVGLYLRKAMAVVAGQVPYRDFPLEYPPLALLPMTVPYLLWPFGPVDVEMYRYLFAGWQAALLVALMVAVGRVVALGGDRQPSGPPDVGLVPVDRVRGGASRLMILAAGAALVIAWRYDLFPALLATVAIWAVLAQRPTLAGVALGLGVLAKLYPIALAPALAAAWLVPLDTGRITRYGTALAVTIALGLLPFLLLAGGAATQFLGYQAVRGLQAESIGGGLVLLAGVVAGRPAELTFEFSAVHVAGPLAGGIVAGLSVLAVAGFALLGWLGWRRLRWDVEAFGSVAAGTVVLLAWASLLMLLVTSKVFSIQYVVWLVPLAALLTGARFAVAAVAVALTMPIHPFFYADLVSQQPLAIALLNARNLLVLGLLAWALADLRRAPAGARA